MIYFYLWWKYGIYNWHQSLDLPCRYSPKVNQLPFELLISHYLDGHRNWFTFIFAFALGFQSFFFCVVHQFVTYAVDKIVDGNDFSNSYSLIRINFSVLLFILMFRVFAISQSVVRQRCNPQYIYLIRKKCQPRNERTWTDDVSVEAVKPVLYIHTRLQKSPADFFVVSLFLFVSLFPRLCVCVLFFWTKFYRVFVRSIVAISTFNGFETTKGIFYGWTELKVIQQFYFFLPSCRFVGACFCFGIPILAIAYAVYETARKFSIKAFRQRSTMECKISGEQWKENKNRMISPQHRTYIRKTCSAFRVYMAK